MVVQDIQKTVGETPEEEQDCYFASVRPVVSKENGKRDAYRGSWV